MKKTEQIRNITQYMEKCSVCKKEIKGFSESQVKYNLSIHIKQKHPEVKK